MSVLFAKTGVILLFLIPLLALYCDSSTDPEQDDSQYNFSDYILNVDGVGLRYTVALPNSYDSRSGPVPMILALHYGGIAHESYGREFLQILVHPAMLALDAVMVAPVVPVVNGGWTHQTSETAVMALIEKMKSDFDIDSQRVAVTGYSLGGIGAWHYAAHFPEIFSVAIPVSGMPTSESLEIFA